MDDVRRSDAAGGVVVQGGRVLLLRKRANDEIRLPKGHVEPGEEPAATALREVIEETGFTDLELLADLGEQLVRYVLGGQEVERRERYFLFRLRSFARRPRSAKDAQRFQVCWGEVSEALTKLSFADEREYVRRAAGVRG